MSSSSPDPAAGPRPRPHLARVPVYVPGRPPVVRPGVPAYKLSSNENPYPPLPGVVEAATRAVATMNRYPDMGNAELYRVLAERLDVPVDHLAAATGSVALIYQLLAAFCEPDDEVVHAWRSFEAYPIAVAAAAARSVGVPLRDDARHDLDAMAAAVGERTRVVLLCTPNNPTGPALSQGEVDAFLARVPARVLVVLDEAYHEFVTAPDRLDALATYRRHPNVVVLRTFSKAYGLAGFRVGYAVAPAPVAAALRAVSLPFGVSSVAQAAAVASLEAQDALLERVAALVEERTRLVQGLRERGWEVPDAQGNFVWLPAGQGTAALAEAAQEAGLVLRPFAGEGVRVTVGEPEATDHLLATVRRGPMARPAG